MWRSFARGVSEIARACRRTVNMPVLLTSAIIGQFAAGILAPVMPLFLQSRGLTVLDMGVVISIGAIAPIVLQPLIGFAADKVGRKLLIVGSSLTLSLLLPVYVFIENIRAFAVLHAARSAVYASGHPAHEAMMGDIMPKTKRATLFGIYGSLKTCAFVVALFSSGYLLRLGADYNAGFYFSSSLFIISSLVLLVGLKETRHMAMEQASVEENKAPVQPGMKNKFVGLLSSFKFVFQHQQLLLLLAIRFCFTFGLAVYPYYIPLLSIEMGAPVEAVGPIVATAWITYAIFQPIGGRLSDQASSGRVGLLIKGLILLVIAGFGIGLAQSLALLVVMWAATGIGDGFFRPGFHALLVDLIPPHGRGQYFGASGAVMTLAGVVAPLVYGFIAITRSLSTALLLSPVMWVLAACCLAVLMVWMRRDKAAVA